MKGLYFFLVAALFLSAQAYAQTGRQVSGVVKDSTGAALPMSTVKLLTVKDTSIVVADASGKFSFSSVMVNQFSLMVSCLGYQAIRRRYTLNPGNSAAELDPVILKSDIITLKGVAVTSAAVKIKEDTIEYNAAAYKVHEGAVIEDALKKMPGLEVGRDGSISAQGKQLNKVRLNGKDYMAGDVKSLTRNLPADLVQNVQVIDDHGDKAKLTGVKTGESQKVLNINIRKDKNYGYFVHGTVGGGRDAIPGAGGTIRAGRYTSLANLFNFRGKRQITISGELNNTNASMFDFNGGRKGPDLFGDKQNGITTARAMGLNYRDDWGEKLTVYGSYSLASSSVYTSSIMVRDNLSRQLPSAQNSNSTRNERNLSHRFNFNIEYKPDLLNYFKFIPSFSYGGVRSNETFASKLQQGNSAQIVISEYKGKLYAESSSPDLGLNALYNHRFHKRGRNFNLLLSGGKATNDQYENPVYNYLAGRAGAPVNQVIHSYRRTDSAGASFSYLEPAGEKSYLEFSYNYHNARTTAERLTDTVAPSGAVNRYPDLSNDYTFKFITNRFGANYRIANKKYNFTLGLAAQPARLEGRPSVNATIRHTTFNFSPVLRYVYNFNDLQALAFNFQGAGSSPAYHQLQPVIDFSNAIYPVQGNPDLLPEYNNTLQIRYNKFGDGTGRTFFSTLSFSQSDHKIVVNTINYPGNYIADPKLAGAILTNYRNASGFYNASGYYVLVGGWAKRKYTWFFNGRISYNNNISYLTDILDSLGTNLISQKNTAKNLILNQGARLRVDIAEVVDAEVNANYLISHSSNSVTHEGLNNSFQTISLGTNGKFYFPKHWTLGYTYSKSINEGYQSAKNPNLLDTYIECRFLKNSAATIRFSVYDIFNENTGFTSTQNAYAITQTNVNRLGRYYLLTFTVRLQKFAGRRPGGMPVVEGNGG
ncbi:MAG TPA: outer membrane beta-barrel protein [Pedobacter sp.]|nr:outer membrane beta-barrel protein [Pedobacter sp.]